MPSKSLFASKTFWGAVVAALGTVAPLALQALGLDPGLWGQIMTGAGALYAVYGRIKASQPIG